jgi:hypothetical protein
MFRIIILVIALVINPTLAWPADASACSQLPDLSAARFRWAAVRKMGLDPAHSAENCRSYSTNFFEAVVARETASLCRDGLDRQRTLELLDSEIDAFNELIATQCST